MKKSVRHVLSLSGGKDSAALAIYMRDRIPEMEYIFHDTDKELPETYKYLGRLEAHLGKKIVYTRPDYDFDTWLEIYGGVIPSNHRRWCTRMLKLKPFEDYIGDDPVINYVGLRADAYYVEDGRLKRFDCGRRYADCGQSRFSFQHRRFSLLLFLIRVRQV